MSKISKYTEIPLSRSKNTKRLAQPRLLFFCSSGRLTRVSFCRPQLVSFREEPKPKKRRAAKPSARTGREKRTKTESTAAAPQLENAWAGSLSVGFISGTHELVVWICEGKWETTPLTNRFLTGFNSYLRWTYGSRFPFSGFHVFRCWFRGEWIWAVRWLVIG